MNIEKEDLENVVLPEAPYNYWYSKGPGVEHYKLLAYLCKGLDLVYDIGTYKGYSACAMSTAEQVISYDVEQHEDRIKQSELVTYIVGDVLQDANLWESDLILLDTYHDGVFENQFLDALIENKYKGVLVLDDIHLNRQMQLFWDRCVSVSTNYYDMTKLGHYTGTGIMIL